MRVLIQRVKEARVTVEEKVVGEISGGLLLFLGIHKDDREEKIPWLVDKIVNMRIFEDDQGKMNRSIIDAQERILVVSQFTLYGDCEKGRRPSFTETMPPTQARFTSLLRRSCGTRWALMPWKWDLLVLIWRCIL